MEKVSSMRRGTSHDNSAPLEGNAGDEDVVGEEVVDPLLRISAFQPELPSVESKDLEMEVPEPNEEGREEEGIGKEGFGDLAFDVDEDTALREMLSSLEVDEEGSEEEMDPLPFGDGFFNSFDDDFDDSNID